ncbi:MAG: hypothetical protein Q3M30_11245 [Candidatus Electrothrix sp. Rat3]|nr:hypothetical protein [Candidatus Electrothrix rattekaaiensis]
MECGRELRGKNVDLFGVCPAATDDRANGIHNGKNGGRCCWVVISAYYVKDAPGCCASGYNKCVECDFYRMVEASSELLLLP